MSTIRLDIFSDVMEVMVTMSHPEPYSNMGLATVALITIIITFPKR